MRNFKGKKDLKISLIRLLAKYKCEKPNFFLFSREKRNETKEKIPMLPFFSLNDRQRIICLSDCTKEKKKSCCVAVQLRFTAQGSVLTYPEISTF
jgi:hypothetical protein